MLDIRLLVFNLGRVDFRQKNLVAYALECQTSLNITASEAAYVCSASMLASVGALVEMQGIVRMLCQIASGIVFEQQGKRAVLKVDSGGPWGKQHLSTTSLWVTCRTLLSHRCWRHFPKLVAKLPEILLGGSLNGVPLQSQTFSEPGSVPDFQGLDKWKRGAQRREARFQHVLHSLDRLMCWARAERRAFMAKVLGAAPPTSKRVKQGLDPSLPRLENLEVRGVHAFDSDVESASEEAEEPITNRCSLAGDKPTPLKGSLVDLLSDGILPASIVADAAFDLDSACKELYGPQVSLAPADIALMLRECEGQGESECDDDVDDEASSLDSDGLEADRPPCTPDGDAASRPVVDGQNMNMAPVDAREIDRLGRAYCLSRGSRPSGTGRSNEERQAFLSIPKHDWMITIGKKSGKIIIVNKNVHQEMWHRRSLTKMPPREQFIAHVGSLFDKELFADSPLDEIRKPLAALHQVCSQRVWGLSTDTVGHDIFKVMRDPPAELFSKIELDTFAQQFLSLRAWMQGLETAVFGHEFFVPERFLVQALGLDGKPVGQPFFIPAGQVDVSRWPHRYIPQLPVKASTRKHGQVHILQVHRKPDLMKFYAFAMSTHIDEIRCRGIWHIVVGWHLYVHIVVSSESLAESVGSFLAVTRRHNITGNMAMKHIVWSSQLRAVGCKGFGGEQGLMAHALNIHFQCTGPEGWHFSAKRMQKKKVAAALQNELRLLSKPAWFGRYLLDLFATQSLRLCKPLPRPEVVIMTHAEIEASRWRHLTPTAKRQRLAEFAERQYNPKEMCDDLWKHLQINPLSVPRCLRPGSRPR